MEDYAWVVAWVIMAAFGLAVLVWFVHFIVTGDLTFASHGVCR